jgi:hypothetical protein
VRGFLVGRTKRVRVGGQLCKEFKVNFIVPQGRLFCPLLFLVYVNDIWRNIDSSIRLFADSCIIYREITNKNDIKNLQKYLNTLVEWAVGNGNKINPDKSKAVRFPRFWVKSQLGYFLRPKNSGSEQM